MESPLQEVCPCIPSFSSTSVWTKPRVVFRSHRSVLPFGKLLHSPYSRGGTTSAATTGCFNILKVRADHWALPGKWSWWSNAVTSCWFDAYTTWCSGRRQHFFHYLRHLPSTVCCNYPKHDAHGSRANRALPALVIPHFSRCEVCRKSKWIWM